MTFAELFAQQLNNPECSVLSGAFIGMTFTVKFIFYIVISYFIIKAIDKLAFEPFIEWIKRKIHRQKIKVKP